MDVLSALVGLGSRCGGRSAISATFTSLSGRSWLGETMHARSFVLEEKNFARPTKNYFPCHELKTLMVATRSSSRLTKVRSDTPCPCRNRIPQLPDEIWRVILWMRAMAMVEDEKCRLNIKIREIIREMNIKTRDPLAWVLQGEQWSGNQWLNRLNSLRNHRFGIRFLSKARMDELEAELERRYSYHLKKVKEGYEEVNRLENRLDRRDDDLDRICKAWQMGHIIPWELPSYTTIEYRWERRCAHIAYEILVWNERFSYAM
eukprot:4646361-Prymnesium_polylepis.1